MTGFLSVFNRDGAPLDELIFDNRLDSVRDVGRDGKWRHFAHSWLALGECVRRDTPEVSLRPAACQSNDCTLVGDIRLDNREDLIRALGLSDTSLPDNELLLAAYCRWGTGCLDQLFGEFSFAIWDDRKQRLFAARDPMGERALYLAQLGSQLVLSNEIRLPRSWPGMSGKLDEVCVAGALIRRGMFMRSPTRTFFEGVEQLPPGHFLIATKDNVRTQRYWSIFGLEDEPLPHASRDDMIEDFRSLMKDAVDKRLRSVRPVGCHLSGGLDSSAIAALAASHLHQSGDNLHCFSHWTRDQISDISATRTVREEGFVEATLDRFPNIISHHAYGDERALLGDVVTQFDYNGTVHPNQYQTWWDEINAKSAQLGLGAMMSGTSGNMTASWTGVRRRNSTYQKFRSQLRGAIDWAAPQQFPILRPEVAKRIGLHDRIRQLASKQKAEPRGASLGRGLSGIYRSYALGRFDLDLRDPLGDRRIVEFCLRAPTSLFQRDGKQRLLIRDSMRGLVPDTVLDRNSRQLQAADWVERTENQRSLLREHVERMSKSDAVNHFLDLKSVRVQLDTLPTDRGNMQSFSVWNNKVLHPMAIGLILEWIGDGYPNRETISAG